MAMAPSVSSSITVRLEVASRGRAVSEITGAIGAGGVVTALDVTAGRARPATGGRRLRGPGTPRTRTPSCPRSAPSDLAMEHAAVVATGRSDYPNQINNVLAFPGVFRGLLDAQGRVTDDMLIAAAQALATWSSPDEIGPHYIIPSVFHPDVASSVAVAVRDARHQRSWPMIGRWTKPPKKLWRAGCSSPPRCWVIPISAAPSSWSWSTSPSRAVSASC